MEHERVIRELQKNEQGYTISELAVKMRMSRQTIANAFAFLEGAEKVFIRQAGRAKIYYWKKEGK